jgi:hypothetical protein
MVRTFAVAAIFGSMLLPTAVSAAAPVATTQRMISNHEVSEHPVSCSTAALAGQEPSGKLELPKRVTEKAASRAGAAIGAGVGTAIGLALFGAPGGIVGAACGGILGEVFFEFLAGQLFRPRPMWPRMAPPLRP